MVDTITRNGPMLIVRGVVTAGFLILGFVVDVFVLPTYRAMLMSDGGSIPDWLSVSVGILPWLAVLALAGGVAFVARADTGGRARRAPRALAGIDLVLLLWLWALGLFFLYGAIEIPRVMAG